MTQIQTTHKLLTDEWYLTIKKILLKGIKKMHVPNAAVRPRAAKLFMKTVAALMSQNLADIAIRSALIFTDFVCDIRVGIHDISDIRISMNFH